MNIISVINCLINALIPISLCVVLPIMIVRTTIKSKINRDNMRKDIILAAMEKNANIDVEEMMKKLNSQDKTKKLLKEKMLTKLQWGLITMFLGIGLLIACGFSNYTPYYIELGGVALLAVGITFIIIYVVGRKMLAKEMEAEEQNMGQA